MALELYIISGSPHAWAVMLGMEIKGLKYTVRRLDPSKKEHKTDAYSTLNPHGKVPTLKHDDTVIYESIAILAYIDQLSPKNSLFGATPKKTGLIWQRVFELTNYLRAPLIDDAARPIFQGRFTDNPAEVREISVNAHTALTWAENILSTSPYLTGNEISAADVVLIPYLNSFLRAAGKPSAKLLGEAFLPLESSFPNLAV
ncbi:MAG: glutathione S-transferase family protein [Alphaproteobacteria bacterium]|nr:glutathione S-transferase family protein [Alphaproteobacteria bacterium]